MHYQQQTQITLTHSPILYSFTDFVAYCDITYVYALETPGQVKCCVARVLSLYVTQISEASRLC